MYKCRPALVHTALVHTAIALQVALQKLAVIGMGSIVEACDSAVPFLVGSLQHWADVGALGSSCTALHHTTAC